MEDIIFGKRSNVFDVNPENTVFVLIAGTSEVSTVPGITSAGATPELTRLTPAIDSEIIGEGKCLSSKDPPMTPEGIPTPAIVTKAILSLTNIRYIIVNGGFYAKPKTPFIETGLKPSNNPAVKTAIEDLDAAIHAGEHIGRLLDGVFENIILAESVPGGTTTAYAVLKAIGINAKTSSSMKEDPFSIKEKIAEMSFRRKLEKSPLGAVKEYGDNMMAVSLGISSSVKRSKIIFGGGTQMATVMYLDRLINGMRDRYISTTGWVYYHRTELFSDLGLSDYLAVSAMDFSGMKHPGLRYYQYGHVREGTGMGAAFLLARLMNFEAEAIYKSVDDFYEQFI
ncbi:hypothetical protein [Thermoplasma volcanium GSS1]|uniref:UPF0284 protein TV0153 n=1 Tax=Thermoplasma volcanium (strain ATCC 51530 / DSM 4299 / JCM 9571 / NBRC 15438 / GSS1) TaxID=273116 RepID=Y153_THEVO|nr:RecName: Full=UPF0284 protein TV0153 [Thermoplasma volcanium GSS1]BAB59295.1 hypothetical protein [Thermoplasma volcanium GSS1]